MAVQIQPQQPKDPNNGFPAIEAGLVQDDEQTVVAVVTYRVAKIVKDKTKNGGTFYPILRVVSIEPVSGDLEAQAVGLREAAHRARTGEALELDFGSIEDNEASGDQPEDDQPGLRLVEDNEREF